MARATERRAAERGTENARKPRPARRRRRFQTIPAPPVSKVEWQHDSSAGSVLVETFDSSMFKRDFKQHGAGESTGGRRASRGGYGYGAALRQRGGFDAGLVLLLE